MMRIAEAIARRHRAQALVTGEVVGQVASQTLENLAAINSVVTMPVLRPLVGMDKDEITAEAQRLGTFPISIIPDQDCCTLFTPRHPATKARMCDLERAEAGLPIDEIVTRALDAAALEEFHSPAIESPLGARPSNA
jgi:thiamine biosynthesis protein ThiI